jgi:FlaA1/EpsC-like NDP-sugar epimerase
MRPVVIIGAKRFARRMWAYLTHDAELSVVAFAAHRRYIEDDTLLGLPVIAIEDLPGRLDPAGHDVCVAAGHLQVNRVRASLCEELESCGYRLLRYVATTATCS